MHISTSSKIFFNCLLHRLTKTWNRGRPETKINIVSENCTIQFAILVHAFVILLKQSISRMRTKNFLLKETEGFPQWTAPFNCHSLFLNQFSLFSKASPSHCDLITDHSVRTHFLISPSFRFPHLFHHHCPPYQNLPRPWYICFFPLNLRRRHFRFCLPRIHPVSLQLEIPVWNRVLSVRTRTKILLLNILQFLKIKREFTCLLQPCPLTLKILVHVRRLTCLSLLHFARLFWNHVFTWNRWSKWK